MVATSNGNDGEVDIMEIWNGGRNNHSCLHWGRYDGKDWDEHRVVETYLPGIESNVRFDLTRSERKGRWFDIMMESRL